MREALHSDELRSDWTHSINVPIGMLNSQMERLTLKEKSFKSSKPASEEDIDDLWKKCFEIDENIEVCEGLYYILHFVETLD